MNEQIKIGSIIKQIRGVSYKPTDVREADEKNAVALLRANNIQETGLNFDDLVYIDRSMVKSEQYLRAGDILICSSSGSKNLVGKAAYVPEDLPCSFGAFCKVVRTQTVDSYYLGQYFQSPRYRQEISEASAGANINNIRNEHIDELTIPPHSKSEQMEIVRSLLCVNKQIDYTKQQLAKLDELVKSRFVELFGGADYPNVLFENVCVFLRNGASIKQTKGAGGYPITRIETLSNDVFNTDHLGYADITDLEKYQSYVLHHGDILISHINSVAYLGRAVQYRGQLDTPIIHGMNLLCARIADSYNPTYIEWFFKTPMAKEYISTITKKAVNQASITTSDLKKMQVPNPPKGLQDQFATFVEQIDKSKLVVQQSLEKLETLKKSLMQQYFG